MSAAHGPLHGQSYAPIDWGCLAKDAFHNRHDAQKSIKRCNRSIERNSSRGRVGAYRYVSCGRWHVGAGL